MTRWVSPHPARRSFVRCADFTFEDYILGQVYWRSFLMGTSKNPLRVVLAVCDARCTPEQLRFSTTIAAALTGF
jgi:hypothetical protein